MNFKLRCKVLFYNFLWRLLIILFELIRMLLTPILYPFMILDGKLFKKLVIFFKKDLISKKQ